MNNDYAPFYASSGICTDTRAIETNSLFICIKGENFDGNEFASRAIEAGAKHVILDNPTYFVDNGTMTLVEDSITYLQQLATHHRRKFDIPVIGITGSNGKTTTKELINTVLSKKYNVLATIGNLNNHLGVPFTLLRLTEEHDIAIIEMGANHFNDIEQLCRIAEPNHGIITNIGKAHLEGFLNFQGVLKTKKELYDFIEAHQGKLIQNGDDEILTGITPAGIQVRTYGTSAENDVSGELTKLNPFVHMKWGFDGFTSSELATRMVGKYNFYNYLAAATFGLEFNVAPEDISAAITEYMPTNNRSQVSKTEQNTLIMDCYNANPTSMRSALESFAMNDHPSKIVVLGDMKELGEDSMQEHAAIIELLEQLQILGYTVGSEFGKIESANIIRHFENTQQFQEYALGSPIIDRLILLKGSRSIGLEVLANVL